VQHRVDAIARLEGVHWMRHFRLFALLYVLAIFDLAAAASLVVYLRNQGQISTLILFAFEFTILFVGCGGVCGKYIIHLVDLRMDGRWANKSLCLFAIEFVSDIARLLLYITFFGVVSLYVFIFHSQTNSFLSLKRSCFWCIAVFTDCHCT
jgi:hypothetical protein